MKKSNIKKHRPNLLPVIILALVTLVLTAVCCFTYVGSVNRKAAQDAAAIAGAIIEKHPEIPEDEIISYFTGSRESEKGQELFEKYGYDAGSGYASSVPSYTNGTVLICLCGLIVMTGIAALAVIMLLRARKKEDRELEQYIKDINRGIYSLGIEENREGGLSRLKNELYKITVLLRESSENSAKEKESLARAIEDISHQIKTPLTSMRILLDDIQDNPNMEKEDRDKFFSHINRQADYISELVRSLLDLAKIDSGTVKFTRRQIDVGEFLCDIRDSLSSIAKERDVRIITDCAEGITFFADYGWQRQAILNIAKNAVEHSYSGSEVYITAEDSPIMLKIQIKDSGQGISEKDVRHIFERFYVSENSSPDSVGIGLCFAKTVIEKDFGYVTVDSEKGKGTVFTVRYRKNI